MKEPTTEAALIELSQISYLRARISDRITEISGVAAVRQVKSANQNFHAGYRGEGGREEGGKYLYGKSACAPRTHT